VRFISTLVNSTEVTAGNYNTAGLTNGVYLAPNSGAWASLSDSNAKTKVAAIKPREILSKVATLPVTEWEYKVDPNRRYIGPMAQDFHSVFGLGSDDKTISTLDSDDMCGLLRKADGRWKVMAYAVSPTDIAYADWHRRFGAPKEVFGSLARNLE